MSKSKERAIGTLPRADKGPIAPAPTVGGVAQQVADAVAGWPNVVATVHWHLFDQSRVDGIDFYVGEEELGHIHLDGDIHLATNPALGRTLIAEGAARAFPYQRGWVHGRIASIGAAAAIRLFKRNYDRLTLE